MAEKVEINAGDVLTPIIITDKSGAKVGAAFINIKDIRIPARVTEVINFMQTMDVDNCDYDTLCKYNDMLEDKFCKLFGYDCRRSLFGILGPTTICNGKYVAVVIIEKIMALLSKEIKEKAANRTDKINKYVGSHKR